MADSLGTTLKKSVPIFGAMTGDENMPELRGAQLTPESQALNTDALSRGGESLDDITKRQTSGMDDAQNQSFKPQGLAMASDPNVDKALADRANRQLESSKIFSKNQIKYSAPETALRESQVAGQAAQQKIATQQMNYKNAVQQFQDRRAARTQVLNSILGAVGSGVGMMMGPKGPAAVPQATSQQIQGTASGVASSNVASGGIGKNLSFTNGQPASQFSLGANTSFVPTSSARGLIGNGGSSYASSRRSVGIPNTEERT